MTGEHSFARSLPRQPADGRPGTRVTTVNGLPHQAGDRHGPLDAESDPHRRCQHCGQPLGYWSIDKLTGLLDRWGWDARALRAIEAAHQAGRPIALLIVDLDWFKAVNDRLGHLAGDDVLQRAAFALRREAGEADVVGRYGGHAGDEFLVLQEADCERALASARRIRQRIKAIEAPVMSAGRAVTVTGLTASIGVAVRGPGGNAGLRELMESADDALRWAKRNGRDRIRLAE